MMTNEGSFPAIRVAGGDADLDRELTDRLSEFNRLATADVDPAQELTVQVRGENGELIGGVSGWTWGMAGGIAMVWVHESSRRSGLGGQLLSSFEQEAKARGCSHVFVTSFTFQAPQFYERHGYKEIFRWDGVPTVVHGDVHLRKDLV